MNDTDSSHGQEVTSSMAGSNLLVECIKEVRVQITGTDRCPGDRSLDERDELKSDYLMVVLNESRLWGCPANRIRASTDARFHRLCRVEE